MVKHPNLLQLFPGVMLDQFLALPLSRLYFHHLFCLQRSQAGGPLDVTPAPFLPQISMLCCFPGSILQLAMEMATPTKATRGSQWHGRMTEVWAHPLGMGMEAACRTSDAFPRMGSSPKACIYPGLCPAPLLGGGALCSTGSLFAFRKYKQELSAPKGCLIFITTAKNLCHCWLQSEFDGAV